MHSEVQSEESLYLLALSHYRSGSKSLKAYHLLKERQLKLAKSKYLLGKCCLDLDKYSEAESVLISDFLNNNLTNQSSTSTSSNVPKVASMPTTSFSSSSNTQNNIVSSNSSSIPNMSGLNTNTNASNSSSNSSTSSKQKLYDEIIKEYGTEYASHVLQILATVYCKTDRVAQAVDFYKKSLRLNPFMWSSFEAICNLGEKAEPSKYFTFTSALNAYKAQILDSNSLNLIANSQNQQSTNTNEKPQPNVLQQQTQTQAPQILKQIDPQSDLFDQKNRQEIANILRMVESDHKLKHQNKQQQQQLVQQQLQQQHHMNCPINQQQQQQTKSTYKENNSEETSVTQQTNQPQTGESSSECCTCCCHTNNTINSTTMNEQSITDSNTTKMNPVSSATKPQNKSITQLYEHLNPATSISLSTPPQLIITNNLNIAPPQKKVSLVSHLFKFISLI